MIDAASVQKLNNSIEKINVQRTKAETRKEMLQKQMNAELAKYQAQYGVKLQGKDFNETKKLINAEVKSVVARVDEEYSLKLKVVQAIESGDYATAYSLLGIQVEIPVEESENDLGALSTEELEDIEGLDESFVPNSEEDSFDESFEEEDTSFSDEEEEVVGASAFMSAVNNVQKSSKSSPIKGTSVAEAVQGVEDDDEEDAFGSFELEDEGVSDSILPDADFGFGEVLKGSKFQV